MRALAVPVVMLTLALVGCGGDAPPTAPPDTPAFSRSATTPDRTTAAARWNVLTRTIVARRAFGPLAIARTFALVSVAQYNAVIAAEKSKSRRGRPSVPGAGAGAAAAVLSALYPVEQAAIDAQLAADAANVAGGRSERRADFAAGVAVGRIAAAAVLARAATDRSDAVWTGIVPVGPGYWVNAPAPAVPLSPLYGEVRPWLMRSGHQFRPAPPPAFGSPRFTAALAEVRHYSDTRTPEQLAVAQFWGAVTGTAGPIGHFSEVGLELAARHHLDERRTARMLAVMHMAGMDAAIGCWDAKYAYWYIRPFQADPAITTPVGRPNFPAYPSAHSCFSAAAGGVLAGLFPAAANDLRAQIEEAGVARIYAGLHFRFDIDAGQQLGSAVAALALKRAPRGHDRIPLN